MMREGYKELKEEAQRRGVVPLDVRTCQLAENMKKKKSFKVKY